ncbi:unnamed protein product [Allacma fusca]|uniref:Uncharacterized protein n=1 Tax=Allacma fusca TaxID=39272 RepID=A0A8J2PG56_9HEXA|nr:unnamed protein product [Allacma fusca]
MDLISVKEKKAMLTESSVVENLMHKLPFEIPIQDVKITALSNLDKLSTICKVVKPYGMETSTAVRTVEVDMEYRKLKKSQQLVNAEAEIRDLKCKIIQVPTVRTETVSLVNELETKISRLEDDGKFAIEDVPSASTNNEGCIIHVQDSADLVEDFMEARKLRNENDSFKQRLKSIPVKPGFDFSKDNLQNLLAQKSLELEDLKSEVLRVQHHSRVLFYRSPSDNDQGTRLKI